MIITKNYYLKMCFIELKKNQQIGLIGVSGSGKSTIIDILCGFRKNRFSQLKVDGKIIDFKIWIIGKTPSVCPTKYNNSQSIVERKCFIWI